MSEPQNDKAEDPRPSDDGQAAAEPSTSGHSTADTQAERNAEDESPS